MTNPAAPHGYEDDGQTPKAPYGWNIDGSPRKSNRGRRGKVSPARSAARPPAGKPKASLNLNDTQRKGMLADLFAMLITDPLATASQAPGLRGRLGKHADALAGDAFILTQIAPPVFDGLILWSKTKPSVLSWLDKTQENAPAVIVAGAVLQGVKAIIDNHVRPNPALAEAGRNMAQMHMMQMAAAVNEEAAAMRAKIEAEAAFAQAGEQTAQFAQVA